MRSAGVRCAQDMHDQCKKMQERIMNLLPKLSQENEGALSKLLSANDKLGEVFILFDSYVAERDRLTNRRAVDRSPEVAHRAGAAGAARSPGDPPDAGAANPRPPSFTDLPPAYPKVASTSALSYSRPAPPPEPEVGACTPFFSLPDCFLPLPLPRHVPCPFPLRTFPTTCVTCFR